MFMHFRVYQFPSPLWVWGKSLVLSLHFSEPSSFGANTIGAAHFVSSGSIMFISNILLVSYFSNSRAPDRYGTQCTCFSCPDVNDIRRLVILIRPKWPSHIISNSSINFRNLSQYTKTFIIHLYSLSRMVRLSLLIFHGHLVASLSLRSSIL